MHHFAHNCPYPEWVIPYFTRVKDFLLSNLYPSLAISKYYLTCKLYIGILWIPSKDNDLLKWLGQMLPLYKEVSYMQIYVETVKLKSKVLIFDYVKWISYLLIDWLIKSSSINWNDKIIDSNTTWILLFQLRVLSYWYMEHSWSFWKICISFLSQWIIWVDEKVWQQFCPSVMTLQFLSFLVS